MGKDGQSGGIEKVSMKEEARRAKGRPRLKSAAKEIAYLALSVALLSVCAWITIPFGAIPVTLQTFAVALIGALLGTVRGTLAVLIYFVMGLIGIPVFSGFHAGVVALLGPTGGYLIGFVFEVAITGLFAAIRVKNKIVETALTFLGALLALAALYFFGTLWFITVYNRGGAEPIGIAAALMLCVVPYILPDSIKVLLASVLSVRLKPYLKFNKKHTKKPA